MNLDFDGQDRQADDCQCCNDGIRAGLANARIRTPPTIAQLDRCHRTARAAVIPFSLSPSFP